LLAGVDLQLDIADPSHVLDALEQAVSGERLPLARVDEAFRRVRSLKEAMFGKNSAAPDVDSLSVVLEESERLAQGVARQSIRIVSSKQSLVPLSNLQRLFVAVLRPHQSHLDPDELPLGDFLRQNFSQCEYHELGPQATEDVYRLATEQALAAEQVVIAMVVKPAAWHRFGLLAEQDHFVRSLTSQRDCILASLGSPVALEDYRDASQCVCVYSDVFASQAAFADFLRDTRPS
jgi:beta-N-acetylhexosaminidase